VTQSTNVIQVPLADIVEIDDMPYRAIDRNHVNALVAANEPATWPPIKVTLINGVSFGLIAGQHRIEAAKRLKLTSLPGYVIVYSPETMDDMAYVDMWEDNAKNGLSYTVAERKEYAIMLNLIYPEMSYREIGRRAGIDEKTVKTAIKKAEKEDEDTDTDAEQRSYNTAMESPAKKLVLALNAFLENEKNMIGAKYGTRNEERRAGALAKTVTHTAGDIELLKSLARTFEKAAAIVGQKATQKKGA